MKKGFILCIILLGFNNLFAQNANNLAGPSTYTKCSSFSISRPLTDMPVLTAKDRQQHREAADSIRRIRSAANKARMRPGAVLHDPVMQTGNGDRVMSGPIANFDGQQEAFGLFPPDPHGAVGPNHFVQAINSSYSVYSKTGILLAGPVDLATLFPGSNDDGDPIVMYDKFADRWFISEFRVSNIPFELLVAISKTNDPTGQYYLYTFNVGSNFNNDFPDYPKYSIWTDGYYCTAQFGLQRIIVLERNRMLKGSPSSGMITANLPSTPPFGGLNSLGSAPKTFDCDGPLPPYGTPNYLCFFENINSGGFSNTIVLDKIATDTTAKTIMVTKADSLATAPFNAFFSGGQLTDISQPGLPQSLDALDGTFNYRVGYMKFVGYNSVALCNTVNVGNMVAGIRWYELRQDDVTLKWSIFQQGTYALADRVSRWNGSICMDNSGDIALAYNVSDSVSVNPGLRYTGRLVSDPPGTMPFTELTAVNGAAPYSAIYVGQGGRCGDYSETTLDPTDGITFWHASEYSGPSGAQNTRIFSFKLNGPHGIASVNEEGKDFTAYQSGEMLKIRASGLPSNDKIVIDLFDINGKHLSSSDMMPANNGIQTELNVGGLSKGAYFLRIGNVNYQKVKKLILN